MSRGGSKKPWNVGESMKKRDSDVKSQEKKKVEMKTEEKASGNIEISNHEYETFQKQAQELVELKDRFLRSAADFENAKKRLTKEREDFFKYALEDIILDLLHVLDNFERALNHVDQDDEKTKPIREGFLLIEKQLLSSLSERGLRRVETVGKPFDPELHEAVEHVICEDQAEGIVIEEVSSGYQLHGRLIRAPKVKVSAKKETEQPTGEEQKKESE
jgi:molecular chaperone GrpE